jgi:hypothetical protein
MTEAEWMRCTDPDPMLEFLRVRSKSSDRKLRLFAVACCRSIWRLLPEERSKKAVEVGERYADGLATEKERRLAQTAARRGAEAAGQPSGMMAPYWAAAGRNSSSPTFAPTHSAYHARLALRRQLTRQARLLRDIVGNPFRPVSFDPAWRTRPVLALTHAAYDNRTLPAGTLDTDCLAILADALEDANCSDAPILEHLRGPGPHVRGCWVVDAVLGKE